MSQSRVLFRLLKRMFALILNEANVGENCDSLLENLDDRIRLLRRNRISDDLHTSLTHLRNAVASLDSCFQNVTEDNEESPTNSSTSPNELSETENDLQEVLEANKEVTESDSPFQSKPKQPTNSQNSTKYTERRYRLQNEVHEMEASKDFKEAMDCFLESKKISAKVFKDENERETKITATQVRVITAIFANLTDHDRAARKCMKYILELNEIFNLQRIKSPFPFWHKALKSVNMQMIQSYFESPERIGLEPAMHIHLVVFRFIKEFTTKPIAMLNWPTINIAGEETYHPILGEQHSKTNTPDPFTAIDQDEQWIDSLASAVNCSGEIFARGVPVKDGKPSPLEGIFTFILLFHIM
jgi:hypothetical protein